MNIQINSLSSSALSPFIEKTLPSLKNFNQKIILITSLALGALAIIVTALLCMKKSKAVKTQENKSKENAGTNKKPSHKDSLKNDPLKNDPLRNDPLKNDPLKNDPLKNDRLKDHRRTNHENSANRKEERRLPENSTPPFQPASEQATQEYLENIQKFKAKALAAYQSMQQSNVLDTPLTQEQQALLETVNDQKYSSVLPEGVKVIRGGETSVFFLNKVPGFVFKLMEDREKAENYLKTFEKAADCVKTHQLNLLNVPKSQLVKLKGKNGIQYFIMQERADLLASDFRTQKGIYSHCWTDPEMQDYMKKLFSQLITFVALTGFSDVKYDNMPLSKDGRVALIDLDDYSKLTGLTKGRAQKNDGLFNYIPEEHLDEMTSHAKTILDEKTYQQLTEIISKNIKPRAQKKSLHRSNHIKFLQKHTITIPSQTIHAKIANLFKDPKKQVLAQAMIQEVNQQLTNTKNFSLLKGRTILINKEGAKSALYETASKNGIFDKEASTSSNLEKLKSVLKEILQELQNNDYIHKYKTYKGLDRKIKIVC